LKLSDVEVDEVNSGAATNVGTPSNVVANVYKANSSQSLIISLILLSDCHWLVLDPSHLHGADRNLMY